MIITNLNKKIIIREEGDVINTINLTSPHKIKFSIDSTIGPQGLQGILGLQGNQGTQGPLGPQGLQGIPGPSGSQGIQGPTGPQGPLGPIGNIPHSLEDIMEAGPSTTLPITASIINASFTGSLYGTSSWVTNPVSYVNSASYSISSQSSTQGTQAIEILGGMPKQLYYNHISSYNTPYITSNTYVGSNNIKWTFTAPASGKVILSLGYAKAVARLRSPIFTPVTGWVRGYLSNVDSGGGNVIIDEDDIDPYNLEDQIDLFKFNGLNQTEYLMGPLIFLKTGLTPGNTYTYYFYWTLVMGSSFWEWGMEYNNSVLLSYSVI